MRAFGVLVTLLVATGCGSDIPVASYFAEYVPFNSRGVDAGDIAPVPVAGPPDERVGTAG